MAALVEIDVGHVEREIAAAAVVAECRRRGRRRLEIAGGKPQADRRPVRQLGHKTDPRAYPHPVAVLSRVEHRVGAEKAALPVDLEEVAVEVFGVAVVVEQTFGAHAHVAEPVEALYPVRQGTRHTPLVILCPGDHLFDDVVSHRGRDLLADLPADVFRYVGHADGVFLGLFLLAPRERGGFGVGLRVGNHGLHRLRRQHAFRDERFQQVDDGISQDLDFFLRSCGACGLHPQQAKRQEYPDKSTHGDLSVFIECCKANARTRSQVRSSLSSSSPKPRMKTSRKPSA